MSYRPLIGSVAALLLVCMTACAFRPVHAVEQQGITLLLSDAQGNVLDKVALCEKGCFAIRYVHSVARSPVEDWFYTDGQMILLEKTIYQDFGAGLPHSPGPGQTMQVVDGHIIISGYHQAMDRLELRVGRIAGHTLLVSTACHGEHALQTGYITKVLSDIAPPGSTVVMTIHSTSLPPCH